MRTPSSSGILLGIPLVGVLLIVLPVLVIFMDSTMLHSPWILGVLALGGMMTLGFFAVEALFSIWMRVFDHPRKT